MENVKGLNISLSEKYSLHIKEQNNEKLITEEKTRDLNSELILVKDHDDKLE